MTTAPPACAIICLSLVSVALAETPASPYAGQEVRDIKSLSPEDVNAYLSGKGMGMAKAAELNGYAGPRHVLELASELELTAQQRAQTEAIYSAMLSKATALGRALVEKERELDRLFATRSIDAEQLARSLADIGSLQAGVRGAHLEAHLAQVKILTDKQNALYARHRGYGGAVGHAGHGTPPDS